MSSGIANVQKTFRLRVIHDLLIESVDRDTGKTTRTSASKSTVTSGAMQTFDADPDVDFARSAEVFGMKRVDVERSLSAKAQMPVADGRDVETKLRSAWRSRRMTLARVLEVIRGEPTSAGVRPTSRPRAPRGSREAHVVLTEAADMLQRSGGILKKRTRTVRVFT